MILPQEGSGMVPQREIKGKHLPEGSSCWRAAWPCRSHGQLQKRGAAIGRFRDLVLCAFVLRATRNLKRREAPSDSPLAYDRVA